MTIIDSQLDVRQSQVALPFLARHNPRPPGSIITGGASDLIMALLRACYPEARTEKELVAATGKGRGSVSWALQSLINMNRVKSIADYRRNGLYLRTRAKTYRASESEVDSQKDLETSRDFSEERNA